MQKLFLCLPLTYRKKTARRYRQASHQYTQHAPQEIMDVTYNEVIRVMNDYRVNHLIHGHTHRPAIHIMPNGQQRIVLAAWHERGNALVVSRQEMELIYF
jgi:UDP-2,3-diacylglucosamine hydrolase